MMQTISLDYYRYVEELLRPQDIHEAESATERGAGMILAGIVAVILAFVHAILIYAALSESIGIALPLIVHIVLSAILIVWSLAQFRSGLDAPFMLTLAIMTSFMGIFGALGTLLCILLYVFFRQNALSFKDWFSLIFPPDIYTPAEETYNKIVVGIDENARNYEVMPFLEVMELGNERQKRRALSKMLSQFHPRLAPAMHKALRDPINAIRVQAATSVAKIESQFMSKLEMIEKARAEQPDNEHVLFALAKYYDDYAYTGLLERERELLNREKAIEHYKAYLKRDPNNQEAWSAIGRLLFRAEKWQEAADWFRNAMERGWRIEPMILWYMECLYRLNDFTSLRKLAREHGTALTSDEGVPKAVRDSLALWSQTERPL